MTVGRAWFFVLGFTTGVLVFAVLLFLTACAINGLEPELLTPPPTRMPEPATPTPVLATITEGAPLSPDMHTLRLELEALATAVHVENRAKCHNWYVTWDGPVQVSFCAVPIHTPTPIMTPPPTITVSEAEAMMTLGAGTLEGGE
ncbi:MAG: hypothetical protein GY767_14075 [Shimia sp.]|nr:hypothetical protein [Shimia sp.]